MHRRTSQLLFSFSLLVMLAASLALSPFAPVLAGTTDYDIENGHFYTQAVAPGTSPEQGYAITDGGTDSKGQTIKLWSEFKRLGGVETLGYPSSRRFQWFGFTVQATQRVVLQWQPECACTVFLNVMDLITEAGQDDYLLNVRQTPKPYDFKPEEQGLSFQQIVEKRYALLNANPAIKAVFFSVPDPLQLNGLPTTPVTDMGDVLVLRAQRKIFQQWKKDVPWARAGDVTVALGGDLAKETGLVAAQDPNAGLTMAGPGPSVVTPPAPPPAPPAPPAPPPAPPPATDAPANPWGYRFSPPGNLIYTPPATFCNYFNCIPNFGNGRGYVVQCNDLLFSKSGGISGSCSGHGGNKRPLYAP